MREDLRSLSILPNYMGSSKLNSGYNAGCSNLFSGGSVHCSEWAHVAQVEIFVYSAHAQYLIVLQHNMNWSLHDNF